MIRPDESAEDRECARECVKQSAALDKQHGRKVVYLEGRSGKQAICPHCGKSIVPGSVYTDAKDWTFHRPCLSRGSIVLAPEPGERSEKQARFLFEYEQEPDPAVFDLSRLDPDGSPGEDAEKQGQVGVRSVPIMPGGAAGVTTPGTLWIRPVPRAPAFRGGSASDSPYHNTRNSTTDAYTGQVLTPTSQATGLARGASGDPGSPGADDLGIDPWLPLLLPGLGAGIGAYAARPRRRLLDTLRGLAVGAGALGGQYLGGAMTEGDLGSRLLGGAGGGALAYLLGRLATPGSRHETPEQFV